MKKQEEEKDSEEMPDEEDLEEEDSKKEESSEEDEGLEERIIREVPFREIVSQNIETDFHAPILERVEEPSWQANLEQNINPVFNQAEEIQNVPVYEQRGEEENEARYYGPPVLKPVEFRESSGRNFFFDPLEGRRAKQLGMEPELINATEFEEEIRRLPFEKKERKYKSAKF